MAMYRKDRYFRTVAEHSPNAVTVLDTRDIVRFASPSSRSVLGYSPRQLMGRRYWDLVAPEDLHATLRTLENAFIEEGDPPRIEYRIRGGNGGWKEMESFASRSVSRQGKRRTILYTQDISERKQRENQLQFDALHDPLTGLPNRSLFMDRVSRLIARAQRKPENRFAVLYLDLDRFKVINDSLGHAIGDRLLIELAARLEHVVRPSDTVARLGGDEFAILLEDISESQDAAAFAGRIQESLGMVFHLDGRDVYTSASIGIAGGGKDTADPEYAIRNADTAMYHAKDLGRGRCAVYDEAMRARALALLELETDLRHAVENQEFRLFYQPVVSLQSGRVAGFEALIRWIHPRRGWVSPGEFIPLAEETGLIDPIGKWTLQEGCRRLRAWQSLFSFNPPLFMSINLSGIQLLRSELYGTIEWILRETGLDPRTLKLEITESVIIEHAEYAADMLSQLKAQNVRISIDDFGTGYSSMSYLRRYPIDTVKIDQSFVRKILLDDESLEIVRTTVTMAHNLGMDVIAEGVEGHDQLVRLRALKCEYGQGYFFAKPLSREQAEDLLSANRIW